MANASKPHQTEKGLWAISIGFYILNGKRTQRKHWLGRDEETATRLAKALHLAWDAETSTDENGKKVWCQESIDRAFAFAGAVKEARPKASTLAPDYPVQPKPKSKSTGYTFSQALDEYEKAFKARSGISERHKVATAERLSSIKAHLANLEHGGVILSELPMPKIDGEWLERIKNHIASRPFQKRKGRTHLRLSVVTVGNWLMLLGCAFKWFSKTERIGWKPTDPDWRKLFNLSKQEQWALKTPQERDPKRRDADGKPATRFTVEELATIFKTASPLGRRYLLMGLLLGWAQEGINSFCKSHFVKEGKDYFIERHRGKTGVPAKWWVAPELAEMIKVGMSVTPDNKHDLAFLTEHGYPLVHDKCDTIRLTWDRCLRYSPLTVRDLPFGRVKKCGAQLVRNISGSAELAQLFLAHTPKTVAELHYTDDSANVGVGEGLEDLDFGKSPFERLHDVQRDIWKRLKGLFYPDKAQQQEAPVKQEGKAA